MRRMMLCGAAAMALAACGGEKQEAASTEAFQDVAAVKEAPKPELGAFGVVTENIDESVKPGDDFFRHMNGRWLNTFKIPDEFASYGSFTLLFERSEDRVKAIIDEAAAANAPDGSIRQKIGDYFSTYVDVAAINAKGFDPVAEDLAYIDGLLTHEDIARAMGRPDLGADSPIGAFVGVDAKRPDRYTVTLTQSGLGMPSRDYYVDEKFADKREKYKAYVEQVLTLAGVESAPEKAAAIYDVEHRMAEVHWEPAKRRNRDLTYNLKTLDELEAYAPEFPWKALLEEAGLGAESEIIVREDDAIANLARIFSETPVETWRAYLTFNVLNARASVLPASLDNASFAFFGTELSGTPKQKERWKRGVASVNGAMGEAVGQVYVEKHFPPSSKSQMQDLVANLRRALDERLDTLDWMGDATKAQAHAKLEKFITKIGYPDKWRDYSALEVVKGDAYGNAKRADQFAWDYQVSKLGKPVDKAEWGMLPQTVNASYSPSFNAITFPAAILQAPFFDPNADPAVNYGAIGAVIGHEVGHGFDDQGRKSDGEGVLRDWWTAEDAANFQQLADRLGAQYASYEPYPGFSVNPTLTMGENIGDLGGLAMAYHAYKLSLNGEPAPIIDGYTGDQRFFMAWAQVWKSLYREDAMKNLVATDPHSPPQYRVNGVVRNMDAWYDAFGVTPEDALYLAPEERVQIW